MRHIHLTSYQRHRLQQIIHGKDRFMARKAIALLELDAGSRIIQVSQNLDMTPQALRIWINKFFKNDMRVALKDRRTNHSGRPIADGSAKAKKKCEISSCGTVATEGKSSFYSRMKQIFHFFHRSGQHGPIVESLIEFGSLDIMPKKLFLELSI